MSVDEKPWPFPRLTFIILVVTSAVTGISLGLFVWWLLHQFP